MKSALQKHSNKASAVEQGSAANLASPGRDLASLYQRYITLVRGRAERLLGEGPVAQQVAHDAVLKLWESHGNSDAATQAAFIYRSITNLCLNKLREGVRQRELERLKSLAYAPSMGITPDMVEMRDILAQVSYDEAQIAAYYYVDGLEVAEIAALLHVEVRTVSARLQAFEVRAARLRHLTGQRYRHVA